MAIQDNTLHVLCQYLNKIKQINRFFKINWSNECKACDYNECVNYP